MGQLVPGRVGSVLLTRFHLWVKVLIRGWSCLRYEGSLVDFGDFFIISDDSVCLYVCLSVCETITFEKP